VAVTNELTDRLYLASHNGLIVCLHDRAYPTPLRMKNVEQKVPEPAKGPPRKAPAEKEPPKTEPGEAPGAEREK
jgi:hypothetical protein